MTRLISIKRTRGGKRRVKKSQTRRFSAPIILLLLLISAGSRLALGDGRDDQPALETLKSMSLDQLAGLDIQQVTIATGIPQSLHNAPAVASVVTAEDIRASGATGLAEALESVAGLHVALSRAYGPIFTLRGMYGELNPQVLVLINGIPITPLFGGNRGLAWGEMPVEAIARVEIIRGPGSAVFGADAFAGVMNIITKGPADIEANELGTRIGSFETHEAWSLYRDRWGQLDAAVMMEYKRGDGHDGWIEQDAQSFLDDLTGTRASLAPGPLSLHRERLDLRMELNRRDWRWRGGYQMRRNLELGVGEAFALDPSGRYAGDRFNTDFTYHHSHPAPFWDLQLQGAVYLTRFEVTRDQKLYPPGTMLPGEGFYPDGVILNPLGAEQHYHLKLASFYTGFRDHTLRVGAGYTHKRVSLEDWRNFGLAPPDGTPLPPGSPLVNVSDTPYSLFPEGGRYNHYLFAQDVWKFTEDWEFTTGLRYDSYSDFGETWNPRLALIWFPTSRLSAKLLYGRAFRAPSWEDLYLRNNPSLLGNPEISPETLQSWELALNYRHPEDLRLGMNFFTYQWRQIIDLEPTSGGAAAVVANRGRQKGRGLELEMEWQPHRAWNLLANYTWQYVKRLPGENHQENLPHWQAYFQVKHQASAAWQLGLQANWLGPRHREEEDYRSPLHGYVLVNTLLRYRPGGASWELALAARNLLDSDIREPSVSLNQYGVVALPGDFPRARRSLWLEGRYYF